jgi:GT2 family glycosyltransferase
LDKKVFVIIVTYNGARWIDKNITSLLQSGYPVQVIVVDNKSTDNSVQLLQQYPEVELILSNENLGFGKANNIGMKKAMAAGADYLFLLNQDAWVFNDTIGSLVAKMEADANLGLLSPKHFSGDGTTPDAAFATYYSRKTNEAHGIARVPFVNAAAWMLSRACVQKVGYFEPLFGHYGEDRNYADRVAYHGFSIGIDTDSKIIHDRVITRNYTKDLTQSKYKILATLINPAHTLPLAYAGGLRETIGLPKYFSTFYGWGTALKMLFSLTGYYLKFVFNPGPIKAARKNAR